MSDEMSSHKLSPVIYDMQMTKPDQFTVVPVSPLDLIHIPLASKTNVAYIIMCDSRLDIMCYCSICRRSRMSMNAKYTADVW